MKELSTSVQERLMGECDLFDRFDEMRFVKLPLSQCPSRMSVFVKFVEISRVLC